MKSSRSFFSPGALCLFMVATIPALASGDEWRPVDPVVLDSRAFNETVRIKLPAGFEVDELPDAVKLNTAFGAYTTSYEAKDGQLIFTRKLVQRAMTLPVEQYSVVRSFFERIRAAEQSPVVLAKK